MPKAGEVVDSNLDQYKCGHGSPRMPVGRGLARRKSRRWVEGYERIAELAAELPHTRLVYVADRESDTMEPMAGAHDLGNSAGWLLRCQHNRNLSGGEKAVGRRQRGSADR